MFEKDHRSLGARFILLLTLVMGMLEIKPLEPALAAAFTFINANDPRAGSSFLTGKHSTFTQNPVRAAEYAATAVLDPTKILFQEVVGGLSNPVLITHAGDGSGRLFVIERSGKIRIIKNGLLLPVPFLDIHSLVKSTGSEQGLLALAFHPSYASNGKFYVAYTATRLNDPDGSILTLSQYSVSGNPDIGDANSAVPVLTIDHPTYSNHNGGTLAFGSDGYLYWSTGDGGFGGDPDNNAQDLNKLLGKILRIDVNSGSPYSVPASNPFYSNPDPNIKKEIWAYGLRNPWRLSFDRLTHDLYIADVGQGRREEIDFQASNSPGGENYGWRVMEGSLCYNPSTGCDQTGKVLPVAEYDHSLGCSVTGGYVYRGSNFPSLSGHYFYGDYCSGRLFSIYNSFPAGWSTPVQVADTAFQITTFGEDEQGELYLADYSTGKIYNIGYQEAWVGSVAISSDKDVVAVGRIHIGAEVASYSGFSSGSLTAYVPMLFKGAFGGAYDSALYVQNVHASNTASITIKYYDNNGVLSCTKNDTISPLSSKGYWVPALSGTCDTGSLPSGWVGGVVVTSNQPIVAVGRPHIGAEVMTYDGFASGSLTSYLPMLFKAGFGSYDSAFYIQNTHVSNTASITIKYYQSDGTLSCTKTDTIAPLASKGYWVPTATCDTGSLPSGWVGGVVVTSDQPIVTVGRPHIGTQITTYNGFPSGSLSSYVSMLFKNAYDSYNAAFYVQNVEASTTAGITIKYYDSVGTLLCTKTDAIEPLASKGYWVPTSTCDTGSLPSGWVGSVVVTSDQPIVAVGRPHLGAQVTTYNGFPSGSLNVYLPMLFKVAFDGSYNAAFYLQNTENSAAAVTIKFYDTNGNLSCTRTDTIPALSTLGFWVPSVACDP